MKIKEIIDCIEAYAPVSLQESWDNGGLLTGHPSSEVDSALITLDVTEEVVDEAISHGEKLIIAHHPLIFSGIKKLNGNNSVEKALIKAIKNDIAIYAAHTSIDVVKNGVSWMMARKLQLTHVTTLSKEKGLIKKLVVFVPVNYAGQVRNALFEAGAGEIGNYSSSSFNSEGDGTFKGNHSTSPFVGKPGELHSEREVRIETVFPAYLQGKVVSALLDAHPYEEVAYDVYSLDNQHDSIGLGVVGILAGEMDASAFLQQVKNVFNCQVIRFSGNENRKIKKVALCGGAGFSLLGDAIRANADIFITGDVKYHQFFDAEEKIILADIGHYESEQFTKELFYEIVTNKFSKFAIRLSGVQTNPVKYLY
ncbi:MAG TPA: Nif3-like dinuclear metal center hexameric protein [Prolixibacteraceae bacterium]|nr:Nif3-like dinuclear metal center hexameric protein [Prolixibacteraceae bacterium]